MIPSAQPKLRLLAYAAPQRHPAHPDVPTAVESGGPDGIEVIAWTTIAAPTGPAPVTLPRHPSGASTITCPRCGTPIQRLVYAHNEANYCPACQTGGKLLADRALSTLMKKDWPKTLDELEALKKAHRAT